MSKTKPDTAGLFDTPFSSPHWRPDTVHPLADLFPMLAADDLAALAEDIKANGLQMPIVIDAAGQLIDGRNRLAACEMAGVQPVFAPLNGHEPEAFIWSSNAKRRQMTKGQIAMVAAMGFTSATEANSDLKTRGRQDQGKAKAAKAAGVSPPRLSAALLVKEYATDLVSSVITGAITLDTAHETAKERKKQRDWRDDGLRMLAEAAPDLAARVHDAEITVEQGQKLLVEREEAERRTRDSMLMGMRSLVVAGSGFERSEALKRLPEWVKTKEGAKHLQQYFPDGISQAQIMVAETRKGLDAVEAVLSSIA